MKNRWWNFFHHLFTAVNLGNHDNCNPQRCVTAAKECNALEAKWRGVEHVAKRGPCSSYPHKDCNYCNRYELAAAIMNNEKSIDEWT